MSVVLYNPQGLPDDKRLGLQARLASLEAEAANHVRKEKERAYALKYHKVPTPMHTSSMSQYHVCAPMHTASKFMVCRERAAVSAASVLGRTMATTARC